MRATCPAHHSCLDVRFQIMLDEEYNAYTLALCNFLHSPVILFLKMLIIKAIIYNYWDWLALWPIAIQPLDCQVYISVIEYGFVVDKSELRSGFFQSSPIFPCYKFHPTAFCIITSSTRTHYHPPLLRPVHTYTVRCGASRCRHIRNSDLKVELWKTIAKQLSQSFGNIWILAIVSESDVTGNGEVVARVSIQSDFNRISDKAPIHLCTAAAQN